MILNRDYNIIGFFLSAPRRSAYGREIARAYKMNQKSVANSLLRLEGGGILKSERKGRTLLFSLNPKFPALKDVIVISEIERKLAFLSRNPKIAEIFTKSSGIVGIFGSYARGEKREGSDLDIFVIGESRPDYRREASLFNIRASVRKFSEKKWKALINSKNTLASEIVSAHIIISGAEAFVNLAWAGFYGFD